MSLSVAAVTVTGMFAEINPEVTVRMAFPGAMAVNNPAAPGFIVAGSLEFQDALAVRSVALPSELLPCTANCTMAPTGMRGRLVGVIARRSSTGGPTVST